MAKNQFYNILEKAEKENSLKLFKEGYKQGINPKNMGCHELFGDKYENMGECTKDAKNGNVYAKGIVAGVAERYLKQHTYDDALTLYQAAGIVSKAKIIRLAKKASQGKKPYEGYENKILFENLKKEMGKLESKTIDNVVTSVMTASGIGILYMLFSKSAAVPTEMLAPPFPNYLVYVLPLITIFGGIYFLWKRAKRDLIPLSF
jgi:hypothetical protein